MPQVAVLSDSRTAGTRPEALPGTLRVSIVVGMLAARDGISNVTMENVAALRRHAADTGVRLSLRVYVLASQRDDACVAVVADERQVAADPHFQQSDVVLFQFGFHSPLFDAIHFAPPAARVCVAFFGITPPGLMHESQKEGCRESWRQAVNLLAADRILVTSDHIARDVAMMGIAADRVRQLPLPPSFARPTPMPAKPPLAAGLRLAYLGRLVPSKGVLDAIEALRMLRDEGDAKVRLDLVGSRTYSDPDYLARIDACLAEHGLADAVAFHCDATEEQVVRILSAAHGFVMPSRHEGFCIPVIEALGCGCFVHSSDGGSLPQTAGGVGRTFPVGRVDVLHRHLRQFRDELAEGVLTTDRGRMSLDRWRASAAEHADRYARPVCRQAFLSALLDDRPDVLADNRRFLGERRRAVLTRWLGASPAPPLEHRLTDAINETLGTSLPGIPAASPPRHDLRADSGPVEWTLRHRLRHRLSRLPLVGIAGRTALAVLRHARRLAKAAR